MTQKVSVERGLIVVMAVCALALALVGGQTLRTNALAVVIGVVVGLVASVLVALLNPQGRAIEAEPVAEAEPRPVAAPVQTPALGVRVDLGRDLGGIPTGLRVGGNGAAHVLVVRAPEVARAIWETAEGSDWHRVAVRGAEDLARLASLCRRWASGSPLLAPTVVIISELDEVLEGPEAAGAKDLHYLLAHGAAAGLHVVAATLNPDLAAGAFDVRICGPLHDPDDLVLALGVEREVAEDMVQEAGVCWLRAQGNNIGFRPEVG